MTTDRPRCRHDGCITILRSAKAARGEMYCDVHDDVPLPAPVVHLPPQPRRYDGRDRVAGPERQAVRKMLAGGPLTVTEIRIRLGTADAKRIRGLVTRMREAGEVEIVGTVKQKFPRGIKDVNLYGLRK